MNTRLFGLVGIVMFFGFLANFGSPMAVEPEFRAYTASEIGRVCARVNGEQVARLREAKWGLDEAKEYENALDSLAKNNKASAYLQSQLESKLLAFLGAEVIDPHPSYGKTCEDFMSSQKKLVNAVEYHAYINRNSVNSGAER